MKSALPRVLLVGAGKFGRQHLLEWQKLVAQGKAELAGIVVRSEASRSRIASETGLPVHRAVTADLLQTVDGVDIVTPSASHHELAGMCLEFTNVLVEKPLATDPDAARELQRAAERYGKVLMVGHVYRHHPVVRELRKLTDGLGKPPRQVTGVMTNPPEPGARGLDPRLEFIHLFDIIDYLFGLTPSFCTGVERESVDRVSLHYPGPVNAVLDVGWGGDSKQRRLSLVYEDRQIEANFLDNVIVVNHAGNIYKTWLDSRPQALRNELETFLQAIAGEPVHYADSAVGSRIVEVASRARPQPLQRRPRVAIIGGGIFGATCAIELGKTCDVTVFERHRELMTEASFANQWRHHSGFHYPRSPLTVEEVKESRDAFVERYGGAVHFDIPCYFGTSAYGIEITAERYEAICRANGLNFEVVPPPAGVADPASLSVCLKTDEAVIDYYALKAQIEQELSESPGVRLLRETEVSSGRFGPRGEKRLTYARGGEVREEDYDFLINATYGNRNRAAFWFNFQPLPIRYDMLELLVLQIDIPPVSMTILDGPFTSLTSMGYDNLFMLSHIHQSIIQSTVSMEEPSFDWDRLPSNRTNLLKHAMRYLPVLERAKYVESRYGLRAVYAQNPDFDGRPTVVTDHGFGCWSVLGGKIITCVSNAREIAEEIGRCHQGAGVSKREAVAN